MISLARKISLTVRTVLADAIDNLLSVLKGRATYYENSAASKTLIKEISNDDILDKATILLTPTAYSNTLLHSVKDNTSDSDFDFERDSSATRVNSDGLIQDMQSITDPELVTNGDFSEIGSDLVTNGSFAVDSNWGGSEDISGGQLRKTGSGLAYQNIGGTYNTSKSYVIECDVASLDGATQVYFGGASLSPNLSVGVNTYYASPTASNTDYVGINNGYSTSTGSVINSISVKQLDPDGDWTLESSWNITDKANYDAVISQHYLKQTMSSIAVGKTVKIEFDISDIEVGSTAFLKLECSGHPEAIFGYTNFSEGTYTYYHTIATAFDRLNFVPLNSGTGGYFSIDNISVKDVTFSEDVDLPRIDYTSDVGHILLEPASTNLFTYSEDFSDSSWTKNGTTVASNNTTAPDGTTSADKITSSGTNKQLHQTISKATSAITYTQSVFIKTSGYTDLLYFIAYGSSSGNRSQVTFDLSDFTIDTAASVTGSFANASATITSYANDWYRITLTYTTHTSNEIKPYLQFETAMSTNFVWVWGAQLEALSYPTSYIPTHTGTTVTRDAETLLGSGNTSLINSAEGVIYVEMAALADTTNYRMISLSDGTDTNRISMGYENGSDIFVESAGTATSLGIYGQNVTETDFIKVAIKYKVNDCGLWIDGTEVATDTSFAAFSAGTLTKLAFCKGAATNNLYGKIKCLGIFNEELTDVELAALTS